MYIHNESMYYYIQRNNGGGNQSDGDMMRNLSYRNECCLVSICVYTDGRPYVHI